MNRALALSLIVFFHFGVSAIDRKSFNSDDRYRAYVKATQRGILNKDDDRIREQSRRLAPQCELILKKLEAGSDLKVYFGPARKDILNTLESSPELMLLTLTALRSALGPEVTDADLDNAIASLKAHVDNAPFDPKNTTVEQPSLWRPGNKF